MTANSGSGLKSRLAKGLGANAFGQVVTILYQVLTIPAFIHAWGMTQYGEWLVLTSVVMYLALADMGMSTVTANQMGMAVGKGDEAAGQKAFKAGFSLIVIMTFIGAILAVGLIYSPLFGSLHLVRIDEHGAKAIMLLMVLYVITGLQEDLIGAGFRAYNLYAHEVMLKNGLRAFELLVIIVALSFGATPLGLASLMVAAKFNSFLILRLRLRKLVPQVKYGFKEVEIGQLRELLYPSLAAFGLRSGNLLSNQAVLPIIGATLGGAAVAAFGTARTLTRIGFQLVNTVNNTLMPEMARAWGGSQLELARSLHQRGCQAAIWALLAYWAAFLIFGEYVYTLWTGGKVEWNLALFNLFLLGTLFQGLWAASSVVQVASNRHRMIGMAYGILMPFTILLTYFMTREFGMQGAALALLIPEFVMVVVVVYASTQQLNERFLPFLRSVLLPPIPTLKTLK